MAVFGTPAFVLPGSILASVYPVGIVVTLGVSTNPATLFGIGTWTPIAGRVIFGIDTTQTEFNTLDLTGGAKTVALSIAELATHTHVQDSHNHTQSSHNHTQDAHTHTVVELVTASGGTISENGLSGQASVTQNRAGIVNNTTATNQAATAVNVAATATNQNTGSGTAHNNLEPYIVKYVWQRAA